MKYPLISIVIPVYNGADYVAEAIESALAQDYPNFEIVVVNDGSKDDGATDKVCKSFGKKIRYFKKPNGGVASALNMGIAKMKGEYFSWLSHDDLYFPNKLSQELSLSKKCPARTLIYSNYEEVDQNCNHLGFVNLKNIKPNKFLAALVKDRFLHGCTLLVPKEAFRAAGLFDLALRNTQDYDLWFRLIEKGWQFKLCPEALVKSRKHNKQTSISTSDRQKIEDDAMYQKILDKFKPQQLISGRPIALGLAGFAVNWQFFGCAKSAQKAHRLSIKYLKPNEYLVWAGKTIEYYLLKAFSRPLLKLLNIAARLRRMRRQKNHSIDNKTKICFIGNLDSSHNAKYAKYALEQDFSVSFITFYKGDDLPGAKIYEILQKPWESKFWWFLRTVFEVRKLVEQIKPDLVQGQYLSSGGVLAYLSGFKPCIVSVLGSDVLEPLPAWLQYLSKKALQKAAWVFTSSETLKKASISFGANPDKTSIFRFGIDLEIFRPAETKPKEKIIFSPRFIDRIYNIDLIIKSFSCLKQADVKLALIDRPINAAYYQEVQNLIKRHRLEKKVIWLPPVPNHKMVDYYNMAEVIISIPRSEGMGASVFEAMACEKKIILNDLPVFREWNRKNNFFITKLNQEALKITLIKALTMPVGQFKPIGQLNRKLVQEKANLENCFEDLTKIYRRLIN